MLQLPIRTYLLIEIEYKVKVFFIYCTVLKQEWRFYNYRYPVSGRYPDSVSGYPAWSGSSENFTSGTTLLDRYIDKPTQDRPSRRQTHPRKTLTARNPSETNASLQQTLPRQTLPPVAGWFVCVPIKAYKSYISSRIRWNLISQKHGK